MSYSKIYHSNYASISCDGNIAWVSSDALYITHEFPEIMAHLSTLYTTTIPISEILHQCGNLSTYIKGQELQTDVAQLAWSPPILPNTTGSELITTRSILAILFNHGDIAFICPPGAESGATWTILSLQDIWPAHISATAVWPGISSPRWDKVQTSGLNAVAWGPGMQAGTDSTHCSQLAAPLLLGWDSSVVVLAVSLGVCAGHELSSTQRVLALPCATCAAWLTDSDMGLAECDDQVCSLSMIWTALNHAVVCAGTIAGRTVVCPVRVEDVGTVSAAACAAAAAQGVRTAQARASAEAAMPEPYHESARSDSSPSTEPAGTELEPMAAGSDTRHAWALRGCAGWGACPWLIMMAAGPPMVTPPLRCPASAVRAVRTDADRGVAVCTLAADCLQLVQLGVAPAGVPPPTQPFVSPATDEHKSQLRWAQHQTEASEDAASLVAGHGLVTAGVTSCPGLALLDVHEGVRGWRAGAAHGGVELQVQARPASDEPHAHVCMAVSAQSTTRVDLRAGLAAMANAAADARVDTSWLQEVLEHEQRWYLDGAVCALPGGACLYTGSTARSNIISRFERYTVHDVIAAVVAPRHALMAGADWLVHGLLQVARSVCTGCRPQTLPWVALCNDARVWVDSGLPDCPHSLGTWQHALYSCELDQAQLEIVPSELDFTAEARIAGMDMGAVHAPAWKTPSSLAVSTSGSSSATAPSRAWPRSGPGTLTQALPICEDGSNPLLVLLSWAAGQALGHTARQGRLPKTTAQLLYLRVLGSGLLHAPHVAQLLHLAGALDADAMRAAGLNCADTSQPPTLLSIKLAAGILAECERVVGAATPPPTELMDALGLVRLALHTAGALLAAVQWLPEVGWTDEEVQALRLAIAWEAQLLHVVGDGIVRLLHAWPWLRYALQYASQAVQQSLADGGYAPAALSPLPGMDCSPGSLRAAATGSGSGSECWPVCSMSWRVIVPDAAACESSAWCWEPGVALPCARLAEAPRGTEVHPDLVRAARAAALGKPAQCSEPWAWALWERLTTAQG